MNKSLTPLEALKEAVSELYSLAAEPVGSGRYRHLDEAIARGEARRGDAIPKAHREAYIEEARCTYASDDIEIDADAEFSGKTRTP